MREIMNISNFIDKFLAEFETKKHDSLEYMVRDELLSFDNRIFVESFIHKIYAGKLMSGALAEHKMRKMYEEALGRSVSVQELQNIITTISYVHNNYLEHINEINSYNKIFAEPQSSRASTNSR